MMAGEERKGGELALDVETMFCGFTSDGRRARHVLVGRVGARSDQSNFEFLGPAVFLDFLTTGSIQWRPGWTLFTGTSSKFHTLIVSMYRRN